MNGSQPRISKALLQEFYICTQLQYNGKLNVTSKKGHKWSFYYRLGRIVWATGGNHPFRRWCRNISHYCPDIDINEIPFKSEDVSFDYWDYILLQRLHEKQKIQRQQVNLIVESTIAELLFDIAQQANFTEVTSDRTHDVILEAPMNFTNADICLQMMQESWQAWIEAGLASFSPNSAPILRRGEELKRIVSQSAYNNFTSLMKGKYTLRDLAVKMKRDTLPVAHSLLFYILKGIIELVEVPDLPSIATESKKIPQTNKSNTSKQMVIACVDDSPSICNMMEQILVPYNFKVVKIQDSVQALPCLIQNKPDLIFLDLIMPVVSGSEICAQLRRMSKFAKTPVVILSGDTSFISKLRGGVARVSGATDFISKPITEQKIINIVNKHLQIEATVKKSLISKNKNNSNKIESQKKSFEYIV
ncbi:MAG: response regulator [Cyanobacteria bacterium P01_A01_bin.45]